MTLANPDYFAHRYFGGCFPTRYFGGTLKNITWSLIVRFDHSSPFKGDPHCVPVIGFLTSRQVDVLTGLPQGTQ